MEAIDKRVMFQGKSCRWLGGGGGCGGAVVWLVPDKATVKRNWWKGRTIWNHRKYCRKHEDH